MAMKPSLFTKGLSSLSQSESANADPNSPNVTSPADQRDDAKRNFLKAMRPLPTQHYWNVYFDRQNKDQKKDDAAEYQAHLEQLGSQIQSVQDFWRYANNTPVDQIKMRESIYLFKQGFKPIWEDRRNINGGSWTFRVPKAIGPDVWTRIQLLAVGEKLESVLDKGMSYFFFPAPHPSLPSQKAQEPSQKSVGEESEGEGGKKRQQKPDCDKQNRRPNMRRRPQRPVQLSPDLYLAPRKRQTEEC